MSKGVAVGQRKAKPVYSQATVIILCVTASLVTALGIAFWNGGDWFAPSANQRSELPFYNLKLSRVSVTRNLSIPPLMTVPLIFGGQATIETVATQKPPVPYLPYIPTPPPRPEVHSVSSDFIDVLREIAAAKLERGGIAVPPETMPDPISPDLQMPMPEEKMGPTNGSLLFHIEAKPDKQDKGAVIFRVSWELNRKLYLNKGSNQTTSHRMDGGSAGPFRVWEKHLESAIIYELEKMITEQIISRYQASNRIGAKGQ